MPEVEVTNVPEPRPKVMPPIVEPEPTPVAEP